MVLVNSDSLKTSKRDRKKRESQTSDLSNFCENDGDVNLEHLQLALAMSKSLQNSEEAQNENTLSNSQQKLESLRETLRQFGFNSGSSSGGPIVPKVNNYTILLGNQKNSCSF